MSTERDAVTDVDDDDPLLDPDGGEWVFAFDASDDAPQVSPDGEAGRVSVFDTPPAPPGPPPPSNGADSTAAVPAAAPAQGPQIPAPARAQDMSRRERRRRVRLQARKVRRIIRHIEPWSVLKISLLFYFCLWIIVLVAGVMLWSVAVSSGTVDNVENFVVELFALEEFQFNADEIFRGFALGGLVMVIAGTAFNVLLCVLFNLISDLTGGIRITVIEEESARPVVPQRRQAPPPMKYQRRMQQGAPPSG